MNSSKFPLVSVIIPTFNEEASLRSCLTSLRSQVYPPTQLEIIIVDDRSTDSTVAIAERYRAKVVTSGYRHIERSKSIGLETASGELILFVDADIQLPRPDWLARTVRALQDNPEAIGAQAVYWRYSRKHSLVNRYCELLGVNDPFVIMLGRRGILSPFEKTWPDRTVVKKATTDYILAEFNLNNLPTLGSQGYMTRQQLIEETDWQPYFFHLDSIYQLVSRGRTKVLLMKLAVEHNYADSVAQFYSKLARNLVLFLRYRKLRYYTYGVGSARFFWALFLMMTLVYPFWQSSRGFWRRPDIAWFLHPIFCFTVPILYTLITIRWELGLWAGSLHK